MDAQITLTNDSGIHQQTDTPAVPSKQYTKPCVITPVESQAQSSTSYISEETNLNAIITDPDISHGNKDSLNALKDSIDALEDNSDTLLFVLDENTSLETLAFELDAVLSDSIPVTHEVEIAFEWMDTPLMEDFTACLPSKLDDGTLSMQLPSITDFQLPLTKLQALLQHPNDSQRKQDECPSVSTDCSADELRLCHALPTKQEPVLWTPQTLQVIDNVLEMACAD